MLMFKKISRILIFVIIIIGYGLFLESTLSQAENLKNDWICIPGERVGPITANFSIGDLEKYFGKENIKSEQIVIGEGEGYENGTFLFWGTSNEILVHWKDDKNLDNPLYISIYKDKTKWRMPEGITVGTNLNQLNLINKKEFFITGLGWQFGGFVSWNNGELAKKYKEQSFVIRVQETKNLALPRKFYGSGNYFSSKANELSKVDLKVDLIRIFFE